MSGQRCRNSHTEWTSFCFCLIKPFAWFLSQLKALLEDTHPRCHAMELNSKPYDWEINFLTTQPAYTLYVGIHRISKGVFTHSSLSSSYYHIVFYSFFVSLKKYPLSLLVSLSLPHPFLSFLVSLFKPIQTCKLPSPLAGHKRVSPKHYDIDCILSVSYADFGVRSANAGHKFPNAY